MKRVLFVDHVDRILGGAEINLIELIEEALRHSDWQIAVACRGKSMLSDSVGALAVREFDYGFDAGLNTLRFTGRRFPWGGIFRNIGSLFRAKHLLREIGGVFQPTTVISCTNKDHIASTLAFGGKGADAIWWVNDLITAEFFSFPTRAGLSALIPRASRFIAVSHCAEAALGRLGAGKSKVKVIYNGIPLERYRRVQRGALRKQLGVAVDQPLYGIAGRLTPWKGQRLFLEIAKTWLGERMHGSFVLIGKAFNEDQAFETALREFVTVNGLGGRIHFAGAQKDMAAALSDLDILLHTSEKPEPFGRVLIEAMAVGTPVIAADAGGPREIIRDGVDGLLAKSGDAIDYCRKLRLLFLHPDLSASIAAMAKQTVEERFTIQRTLREFDKAIVNAPESVNWLE